MTYDSKGNLTTNSNGHTYTWDFDNRMGSIAVPVGATEGIEGTHTYAYDALGRRVSKAVDGESTTVFISLTELISFSKHAGQVISEFTIGELAENPQRSVVCGNYIDEPVLLVSSPGVQQQNRKGVWTCMAPRGGGRCPAIN